MSAAWPFGDLIPLRYRLILMDFPWKFETRSAKGEGKSAQAHYPCMTIDEGKAMPVGHLAAPDCALVMWGIWSLLPGALELMAFWGFEYKTGGAWAKQSKTGKSLAFGGGYIYRGASEFWLLGTIGEPKIASKSVRNLIVAPLREHSRKPDQMHRDLERLYPGPRCELFARQRRPGWDVFGNQIDKFSQPTTGE